ncbi:MAG: RNA polymerase sigma factor, partial [Gemmataceae bacterium]
RRAREKQMDELPHPPVTPAEPRDWRSWLDHELNLLPERYRAVLVACDLEELSRKEAARLLGLAEGTVSSRLARGRSLLAKRLSRYGLSLSSGTLAAALSSEASAALPLSLTSATMSAATGTGIVSASVGFLTKGALKAMLLTKLKWTVGVVMVAMALGATGLAYRVSGQAAPAAAEKEVRDKTPTELEILRREVELLKLKLEIVQEKQRAQEMELRALRAAADGKAQLEVDQFIRFFNANFNMKWPKSLQRGEFETTRESVNAMMKAVYKSVTSGNNPRETLLIDLLTDLRKMHKTLDANVDRLSPEEFIEANRHLRSVKNTITALKAKAVPSGRQPAGESKPKAQPEADVKNKVEMLRSDLEMWKERANWSERMSRPGRQYVPRAQAEADQARLRSARLALRQMEIQLHLQEVESALKALREARDPKAKQRAADELEKVLKNLREQMDKQEGGSSAPR